MKNSFAATTLGVAALTPVLVMMACGGKVAGDTSADAPATAETATGATPSLSTKLAPCPADSAPLPVQDGADPELLSLCTQLCDRNFACLGCSYGSCVPTCLNDGLKSRPCGAAFVAWQRCVRAHSTDDHKCGSVPACDAEYCAYATCGASPGAPVPSECH